MYKRYQIFCNLFMIIFYTNLLSVPVSGIQTVQNPQRCFSELKRFIKTTI